MPVITQLVRPDILSRLTETQLQILTSVVEAEIVQNASIRKTLSAAAQPTIKRFSEAGGGARTPARKSK
jgi:hypothetical protein